ncbi:superoxide dismutase family protein [Paenibacillus oenotherae]|uniref:Superoxide dismutase family protein n=1 Tax=Paenibacillus oenotherae TaxID=1435645 RepID=A0ABS7D9C3_9BACL|nr:superoxide dismutase family protein [Paenibacillus oenotherae]MBW7476112.1 superoxide dismutase family protein [Paenibacillus oenotherae]
MIRKSNRKYVVIAIVCGVLLFTGAAFTLQSNNQSFGKLWARDTKEVWLGEMNIPLVTAAGAVTGHVRLSETDRGIQVNVQASGLKPGKHGFHLHEKKFENNDFKTAGAHYNPEHKKHGHLNPEGPHQGDYLNLNAGADGTAHMSFVIEGMTLEKGKANSIQGKSFIVHADEDDYKTDPSGNSGDRIAGGNVG